MSRRKNFNWKTCFLLPFLAFAPLTSSVAHADTPDEQWTFASGLYDQKLWGLAAQNLQKFLVANPKDAHAKLAAYQLGAALYRAADAKGNVDYAAAAKAYQNALANYPDEKLSVPARFELADAQFNLKQYAPAVTSFTQFLSASDTAAKQKSTGATAEQRALANYLIGESQLVLKKSAPAKAAYQRVLKEYPQSAPAPYAQLAIGVIEEDAGQLQNAKAAYDAVVTKYPKSEVAGEARLRAANATLNLGRFDEAATAFQNALADPNAAQWKAEAHIGQADALFGAKKWAQAGAAYDAALQVLAANDERRAGLQMRVGDSAFNSKDYEKSQTAYATLGQNTTPTVAENALYFRGRSLFELKRNDEAAKQFEALLQRFPKGEKAPRAALLLGDVYAQAKDTTRAATAYRTVLTQYPQSDAAGEAKTALVDLASGVAKSGASDEKTGSELGKVLASLPPGVAGDAQLRLAQAAYSREDWAQATTLANAALAGKPNAATAENALFLLASAQYNAGKSADASKTFQRQLAAHPKGPLAGEAQVRLAWSLIDLKKWDEAETAARAASTTLSADKSAAVAILKQQGRLALAQALWGAGKNAPAATVFGELTTSKDPDIAQQSTYGAAQTLEAQKQWTQSAAQWARYAELSEAGAKRADAYLHQGLALTKAKNGAQALAAFDRAIAVDPNGETGARALLESAWAAHDLGQKEQETQRWQKLSTLDSPYAATALLQQGQMMFDAKKWPEAATSYRVVLDKFPQSREAPLAAYQLGTALYNSEQWREAATAYERAAQTPDAKASDEQKDAVVEALFWNGESLRRAGDANAAVSYRKFIAAIALRPQIGAAQWLPQARLGLGRALNQQKQWNESATTLRALLAVEKVAPDVAAEANFLLAQSLEAQNKPQEAATQALKVTTLYPQSAWAAQSAWIAATSIEKNGNKNGALELYRALATRTDGGEWATKAQEKVQNLGG